ncbi:MAG: ksdD [Ilumatobacteraceae bacterium]|nr:ksdD [Ilumatobacteraceae bacterium]
MTHPMTHAAGDGEHFDVIVVGSGGGLIGAYAAAARGLRTLVIEKTEHVGGTTAYSGAGIWLPGNAAEVRAGIEGGPEAARPYLDAIVGDDSPVELREAYLQGGVQMIAELEENPHFQHFEWRGVPDYFPEAPGSLKGGRTIFPPEIDRAALGKLEPLVRRPLWTERWGVDAGSTMVGGQALIARALLAFVETGHGTIRTNARFERLIVEDGNVIGVEVTTDAGPTTFFADRGVLLAAGGFEHNRELRQRYQPPMTDEWTSGCAGNTGDALVAGIEVGAATALLDEAWFAPGIIAPDQRAIFFTMVWSGIWVNGAGERFMNERLPYDRAGHELLRNHLASDIAHVPAHWVFDHRQIEQHAFAGTLPVDPQVPDWFDVDRWRDAGVLHQADTLDELAELIGVPAGNLTKTVETFNGFAVAGVDEDFHRGETPWDRVTARMIGPHLDGPNKCLGVIDQPPYYAVQIALTDLGTKGGLVTDGHARVLRPDGSVIGGLYASGNTMAPMSGRVYPGAGAPIGAAMTFSYLAAVDMAATRPARARSEVTR